MTTNTAVQQWTADEERQYVIAIKDDILYRLGLHLLLNPLNHGGGGPVRPSSLAFCLLLKIMMRHPYLKILDLANLFDADAPIKR